MELFVNEMGEGFPLIIMHGLFGISDNWVSLGRKYATDFKVYLVDLPNHGRSAHYDEFDTPFMASKINEFMGEKGIEKAYIMGHSLGGKVAMQLACLYPEKVEKLIVADIGPKAYPIHHQTILLALNSIDTSKLKLRSEADEVFVKYGLDEGTRQFLLKNLYWKTPEQLDWRFNLKVITEKISEVGKALPADYKFEKETLFIRGGASGYVRDEDWPAIRRQFPIAVLDTIEGVGHWLHAQNPQEYYTKTMSFLK